MKAPHRVTSIPLPIFVTVVDTSVIELSTVVGALPAEPARGPTDAVRECRQKPSGRRSAGGVATCGGVLLGVDPGLGQAFPTVGLEHRPDPDPEDEQDPGTREDGQQELQHPTRIRTRSRRGAPGAVPVRTFLRRPAT